MIDEDLWKKAVIIKLLNQSNKKIKKSLGQHYLIEPYYVNKIVEKVDNLITSFNSPIQVLEIGPGLGVITQALLRQKQKRKIIALEIDEKSILLLQYIFSEEIKCGLLNLIHKDILNWDGKNFENGIYNSNFPVDKWLLVGNLPYQITSQILFMLCEKWVTKISAALFMIQKEVSERIRSEVGVKNYGILSVVVNYFFIVKKYLSLSPQMFYPQPRVCSEIIELIPRDRKSENKPIIANFQLFKTIVKASFHNRRKQILNSVNKYQDSTTSGYSIDSGILQICFKNLNLSEKLRAENLMVDDYVQLSNLYNHIK